MKWIRYDCRTKTLRLKLFVEYALLSGKNGIKMVRGQIEVVQG